MVWWLDAHMQVGLHGQLHTIQKDLQVLLEKDHSHFSQLNQPSWSMKLVAKKGVLCKVGHGWGQAFSSIDVSLCHRACRPLIAKPADR